MELKPIDTALEIMGWTALATLWLFAGWEYMNLPEIIPIHFDMLGKADEYGGKDAVFTMPVLATLLFFGSSFLQRKVSTYQFPEDMAPENPERQSAFAVKTLRIVKVAALFMFWIIEVFISRWDRGLEFSLYLFIPVLLIIIGIPVCYSVFKAKRNK